MHQIDHNDLQFAKARGFNPIGWVPCPRGEQGKINPQVTQMFDGKRFFSVFHVKPVYYETLTGEWRPLSEVTSHHGNHKIIFTLDGFRKVHPRYINWLQKRMDLIGGQLSVGSLIISPYVRYIHDTVTVPKIGLTTTTVYPDPHPESTTVDGRLKLGGRTDPWATIRAVTTSSNAIDNGTSGEMAETYARGTTNNWDELCRAAFLFDTSAIPDTDSIDSGSFSIYVTAKGDIGGALDVSLVSKTTSSNTSLATSDFNITNFGSTEFATALSIASLSTSAYNNWTLNASGLAGVSVTGVTKLGVLLKEDLDNTSPTWSAFAFGHMTGYYADQSGTSTDPKLAVVHSAGSTFIPKIMMVS